jgi:hypothetical protein
VASYETTPASNQNAQLYQPQKSINASKIKSFLPSTTISLGGWFAVGWLSPSWKYRKSHVINPSSGAGTGYQVKIVAHYGSGVDSGGDVYLNGKCRSDFADLRFTASDGVTLLSYWIEEKVDGDHATIWVKVNDDLSTNPAQIFLYYGNPTATTTSNGVNTFVAFDSFDRPDQSGLGTADSGQSWTINAGTWSITSNKARQSNTTTSWCWAAINIGTHSNVAVDCKVMFSVAGSYPNIDLYARMSSPFSQTGSNRYWSRQRRDTSLVYIEKFVSNTETVLGSASFTTNLNQWYLHSFRLSGSTLKFFVDNVLKVSVTDTAIASGVGVGMKADYVDAYFDDFRVRKYVDPEPANGSWGVEEVYTPFLVGDGLTWAVRGF